MAAKKSILWGIIILVGCAVVLVFTYSRMKIYQQSLNEYWDARNCLNSSNCREKLRAIITNYRSVDLHYAGGKGISLYETSYFITVKFQDLESREIKILGDPVTDGTPFDVPNVVTLGSDPQLASENLFAGREVYLEVWKNKITLLFVNALVKLDSEEKANATNDTEQTIVTTMPLNYDIAIPAEDHPIILASGAERDFYGSVYIVGWIVLFGVFRLLFGIRDIVKKKKSEKMELA